MHLDLIYQHTTASDELNEWVKEMMEPFQGFHGLTSTNPRISGLTTDILKAETGAASISRPT